VSEHPPALVGAGQTYVTGLVNAIMRSPDWDKFIADDFLGGQRLDPTTDGRPDPGIDVREASPLLGSLVADFNFNQQPRPPRLPPVHPPPSPASQPPG
jgi:hypothetical protein